MKTFKLYQRNSGNQTYTLTDKQVTFPDNVFNDCIVEEVNIPLNERPDRSIKGTRITYMTNSWLVE